MWVDNIKINVRDIEWDDMDWVDVTQDRDLSGSVKFWKILELLHGRRFLKE
jgi:hypothetical protein